MASLRIHLLGGFDLRLASGAEVRLPTRKSRSLLAYLALVPGRAQPRARLMGLLWSDRAEPQARGSLRQELHALRQGLAGADPPALRFAGDAVELDAGVVEVDALPFERLAGREERTALEQAAALYRGDLLAGLTARDPVYDDWLTFERRRFRDLAVGALGELLVLQTDAAADLAVRLEQMVPALRLRRPHQRCGSAKARGYLLSAPDH
jgi:DNA-binding SARP family transcriptional activator